MDLGGNRHHGGVGGSGTTGSAAACVPGAIVACYDGPPGTEGIGLCKPGSKACTHDGAAFGPCTGAILPVAENCATPVDEDCDGLAQPCKGKPIWSDRAGDDAEQHAFSTAADSAGNVLVTGTFSGSMDFGGCPLSKVGDAGLFVVKLDPSGACLWSKSAGDLGTQFGDGVTVDSDGSILLTGYFTGTMDLGGCPLSKAVGTGLFVAKLDPLGECLWIKSAGDPGIQFSQGVAVDHSNNILVTGYFFAALDFGGCPLTKTGSSGLFVAKLDPSGACLWSKGGGDATGYSVATDGASNVLVTGTLTGAMDFGGCPLSKAGDTGLFVAKLDPSGACVWNKGAGNASGYGIALDGKDNVLTTGLFTGAMDFGGCPLSKPGSSGLFVAKLDSLGACLWSKDAGDLGSQSGQDIAVDSVDNVVVTGYFKESLDFGQGSIACAGYSDVFILKLDTDGKYVWSQRGGGPSSDLGMGVAVDGADNVLVTGDFNETANFGAGPLVSAGGPDVFVAKFGP
jgi:hypothetical protein